MHAPRRTAFLKEEPIDSAKRTESLFIKPIREGSLAEKLELGNMYLFSEDLLHELGRSLVEFQTKTAVLV